MAVILFMASDVGSAGNTSRFVGPLLRFLFPSASPDQIDLMHGLIRKAGHLTEYAVLAALWVRAFDGRRAWRAWTIAVGWAVVDETFQSTTSARVGSVGDVVIDAVGALGGALWRARKPTP
jgi:VanZ family protein